MKYVLIQVDQLFSVLAQTLKGKEISTQDELVEAIESAPINPTPLVKVLYFISDWRSYMNQKLSREKLSYHSGYHCFKISSEKSKVCFRGKVLSTDENWFPPRGIQLLADEVDFSEKIKASEFRIDHQKKMEAILHDIKTKYLPTLDPRKRLETDSRWKALDQTFQHLEKERKSLKTLSLADLPKFLPPPTPDHSDIVVKNHGETTPLWGSFYPEEVLDGNVESDAKLGLDVVVFTHSKSDRPWVGIIKSICNEKKAYSIHWHKRAPGGGIRYKADTKRGAPYISEVDSASIMLYSVADHLDNGDLDLSELYDKVMSTYDQHDKCY